MSVHTRTYVPEAVLMVDGSPDPLSGVSRVSRVPLGVEQQVDVAQVLGTASWEGDRVCVCV